MEKNQEKTKMDTILAERMAAHQLMTQFVKDNASEVAHVISELVPFICGEADLSSLKSDLNTVNITFATVALDVIRSRNNEDTKEGVPLCLPADALEMQNALYELSRFFKMFAPMADLFELNKDMPAFKMSISCFDTVDSL